MNNVRIMLVAAVVTLFSASLACAASEMRDGKWEITTSMDMPGMPYKMKPTVVSHCYSKDDVKDRKNVVANKERNKDCKITDMKHSGNKTTWTMVCTGKNEGTFTGETVFKGDSYTSTMTMNSKGHNMTTKTSARRVGDCR